MKIRKIKKAEKVFFNSVKKEIFRKTGRKVIFNWATKGYFLFEFGNGNYNLCVSLKERPNFYFGIWGKSGKYQAVFGEHKSYIDKFKPTASTYDWTEYGEKSYKIQKQLPDMFLYFIQDITDYDTYMAEMHKEYDYEDEPFSDSHVDSWEKSQEIDWNKFNELKKYMRDCIISKNGNEIYYTLLDDKKMSPSITYNQMDEELKNINMWPILKTPDMESVYSFFDDYHKEYYGYVENKRIAKYFKKMHK